MLDRPFLNTNRKVQFLPLAQKKWKLGLLQAPHIEQNFVFTRFLLKMIAEMAYWHESQ